MAFKYNFHHIGIATKSIDKCVDIYHNFGYNVSETKAEPSQNVNICFLSRSGSPLLEIIEPLNNESPISRIVQNSGTTPYHLCFEVDDILKSIKELEEIKFRLLFEPITSEAMDEGLFCYLFSSEIGLIELYQKKKI
jgi:methylmalonyl-CoA/ethylmalonyl-CoA epimerase